MRKLFIFLLLFTSLFGSVNLVAQTFDWRYAAQLLKQQDYNTAINYLESFAQKNDANALIMLAKMYWSGTGVRANRDKALDLYQRAAINGNVFAQNYLGCHYEFTEPDPNKSLYWYQQAANNGWLPAYFGIAQAFHLGKGTQQNMNTAFQWYQRGAEKREFRCEVMLSYFYEKGIACQKNKVLAEKWLKQALEDISKAELSDKFGQSLISSIKSLTILFAKIPNETTRVESWDNIGMTIHRWHNNNSSQDTKALACQVNTNSTSGTLMPVIEIKDNTNLNNQASTSNTNVSPQSSNEPTKKTNEPTRKPAEDLLTTQEETLSQRTFVVIIANENYQEVEPVEYALNDGKTFSTICNELLGIPKENIKIRENATLNNMISELTWLKDVADAYKGKANVIFYYAGHGIPDVKSRQGYLLPTDGIASNIRTAYALKDLYKTLNQMNTEKTLVLLDACFSGSQRGEKMLSSARGVEIAVQDTEPTGNIVVFSAAQGDQTAFPYKEQQHGLFTYWLIEGLKRSNGNCTLGELTEWTTNQVLKKSTVINKKKQSPTVISSHECANKWKSFTLK